MESLKTWLIEMGIKTAGPSAIRGAILGISAWFMAKDNMLSAYGIVSNATLHTTTIYWDKVSVALILGLPAAIAAVIKVTNTHAAAAIKPSETPTQGEPKQ